jgi:hypothetical protein
VSVRVLISLLILLPAATFACGAVAAEEMPASLIPLEKGTCWVYEARVKWTPVADSGQSGVQSDRIRWTSQVLSCVQGKSARAAVIRGFPTEILGMDPVKPAGYTVLVQTSNRLYSVSGESARHAGKLARQLAASPERLAGRGELLLDLPLHADKRWGAVDAAVPRTDGWYCWRVEAEKVQILKVKGVPADDYRLVYIVAFRTNPDHEVLDIAPGVGITHLEYEHHGTVGWEDVRLVQFQLPKARAKPTSRPKN